ncbi:hypothetical protein QUB47_01000 [Microcoleus sp. AT9_B5]
MSVLPEIRTRHCRVPTIDRGRETALPCPLSHSGAAGIHTIAIAKHSKQSQMNRSQTISYSGEAKERRININLKQSGYNPQIFTNYY